MFAQCGTPTERSTRKSTLLRQWQSIAGLLSCKATTGSDIYALPVTRHCAMMTCRRACLSSRISSSMKYEYLIHIHSLLSIWHWRFVRSYHPSRLDTISSSRIFLKIRPNGKSHLYESVSVEEIGSATERQPVAQLIVAHYSTCSFVFYTLRSLY